MSRKSIALCLAVVPVGLGMVACGLTPTPRLSERLVGQIDSSSWIRETFTVSPDNRRVAYGARVGDKRLVVVDGKEEKQYDRIGAGSLIFSPDSQRVACAAQVGDKWLVVVDGKEEKPYDDIAEDTPIFSPDSQRVAYGARVGDKWFVVVDGQEGKPYDGIAAGMLIFSPDSQRVAYAAEVGDKRLVVVDGQEGKPYDGIVTKGGGRIVFDSADRLHYLAVKGDGIYLVEERIP